MSDRKPHPLDEILKEIAYLLEFAQKNANKPPNLDEEKVVNAKLDRLENLMGEYKKRMQTLIKDEGITQNELNEGKYKIPKGLTKKELEIWKRATQMWWDAGTMKSALDQAVSKIKKEKEIPTKSDTHEERRRATRARIERFKRIGGKKHWKPL